MKIRVIGIVLFLLLFNLALIYLRKINLFLPILVIVILAWLVDKYLFKA